jgi:hypothetical protein
MEHAAPLPRQRPVCLIVFRGKKRNGCLIPGHENRNPAPHSMVTAFETKDIDVPVCRTFNIPHRERDMIESFQFKHFDQSISKGVLEKANLEALTVRMAYFTAGQFQPNPARLALRKLGHGVALALMRRILSPFAALLLNCAIVFPAEVQVELSSSPKPKKAQSPQAQQTVPAQQATPAQQASPAEELLRYRPALLRTGPNSVINRIDTQDLIKKGQKDGSVMFCCSVRQTGEIANTWTYRGTPESLLLEQELVRRLDQSVFIPAIYNREPVHVLFYGTVIFKIVNGKPRLRIFANQEAEELKKETDFVGPQPFVGHDSKFEGLHYPNDVLEAQIPGLVELGMKIDADGNLKELRVVSEDPPLVGFRRAAAEDFRVARFIPAFRDGKPVECSITLPVYYEP